MGDPSDLESKTLERLLRVADSFALPGSRRHLVLSPSDAAAILAALAISSKDTEGGTAQPFESVERATIDKRQEVESAAIWRRALGDATVALGALETRWASSRRKAEREAGGKLTRVLEILWEARDSAPISYPEAVTKGERMIDAVREYLAAG